MVHGGVKITLRDLNLEGMEVWMVWTKYLTTVVLPAVCHGNEGHTDMTLVHLISPEHKIQGVH